MNRGMLLASIAVLGACDEPRGPRDSGVFLLDAAPRERDAGSIATDDAGGELDAGSDAGPDAGPVCWMTGGCHPLYDADCRCGYSTTDYQWECGRSGSGREGAWCELSDDCAAGLYCPRSTNNGAGQCRRLCDEDSDCAAGEGCALVDEIGTGFGCAGYCLPFDECSLIAQDCAGACYWLRDPVSGREHTFCNFEGAGADGGLCAEDPTACMRGSICVSSTTHATRCQSICQSDAECSASLYRSCSGVAAGAMHCR